MRKRGSQLLTAGEDVRAEPIVTYTRLTPGENSAAGDGRVEPHFTAVRVDRRGRPNGARRDAEHDDLPLVDAPPSDVSIDPMSEVSAGEIRVVRRRRGPRIAMLAGALAVVAGAGVLAASYSGITGLELPAGETNAAAAVEEPVEPQGTDEAPLVDATGRTVRVVGADTIPPFAETAALAPRAAADPVAGEAALSDQATVSGEAALSAEPPDRVIANPPLPRLRPATAGLGPQLASTEPQLPAEFPQQPLGPAPAPLGTLAPPPLPGDVDSALANVDRILTEQRAAAGVSGSGDGEFYGPPVQPLPYPVQPPLPGPQQASPQPGPSYPVAREPYGPFYPGQAPYAVGQPYPPQPAYPPQPGYPVEPGYPPPQYPAEMGPPAYPLDPQIYEGVDVAAGEPVQSPWWLPKRRALIIPNAPVPPAEIPQDQHPGGVW
jgi:hypothetical protein